MWSNKESLQSKTYTRNTQVKRSNKQDMASMQVQKATCSDKGLKQPQNGAQLTVFNQTSSVMTLNRSINWAGSPASPGFPQNIGANAATMFTHLGNGNFGSEAAVVYTGINQSNLPCAWVLAWKAPADSTPSPNKVYVTCGPKSLIDTISFDQIRLSLNNSLQNSNATDQASKTSASASINDSIPNVATVGANFSLTP